MTSNPYSTPVLVVIFNRPDKAQKMLEVLRQIKPARLYVAADGARADRPDEAQLCAATRAVFANVDWPCQVQTDFLTENIGPCKRVPTAIDWLFTQEEEGIILEDDCLPDPSFFPYCAKLLEKYRDDDRVMTISGSNFQGGKKRGEASYYFSIYPTTWGWATWRRAWALYDDKMTDWPAFQKEERIKQVMPTASRSERNYWLSFFDKGYRRKFIFWDLRWIFTMWDHGALSAVPNQNLIKNIGFGKDATHTKEEGSDLSIETKQLGVISHPTAIVANEAADRYLYRKVYRISFWQKVKYKLNDFFS